MDFKPMLVLDFDEVIVNSITSILTILNKKFKTNFQATDVKKWDFSDVFPQVSPEEIESYFETQEFWDNLTFKPDALYVMNKLNNLYDILILSKGTKINLEKKHKWIYQNIKHGNLPTPVLFYGIGLNESKSAISLEDSILIDDSQLYLNESNAGTPILYENYPNTEWNNSWEGLKVTNWKQLYYLVNIIYSLKYK